MTPERDELQRLRTECDRLRARVAELERADDNARRESGEAPSTSVSLFDSALNATNDGVLIVGPRGRITYFNQAFLTMWRVPATLAEAGDDDAMLAWVLDQLADPEGFLAKVRELYAQPEADSADLLEFRDSRCFERRSQPQRLNGAVIGRVWWFRDITERRRMERELAQSEERFAHIFQASPFSILLATYPEGRIVAVNEAFLRLFGFEREDVIGRTTGEIGLWSNPEDREIMLGRLGAEGAVSGMEFTFRSRHGDPKVLLLSVELVQMQGQWHALAMSIDITERRRVEDVVRRQGTLLQAIMNGTSDAVFIKDREGRYELINPAGALMLGHPVSAVLGRTDRELVPPEAAAEFQLSDERVMSAGEPRLREEVAVIGGRDFVFLSQKAPWRDGEGRVIGLVGISRDITERKRTEAALRESESRYRTLFEAIGETIFLLSPEGTFQALNRAFETTTGWERTDWLGRSFLELLHPGDHDRARDMFRRAALGEKGLVQDFKARRKAGDFLVAECSAMHRLIQGDRVIGFLGTARDVTQQRRLEDGLRQAQKLEALGTLAGGIAHDFNNILTAIMAHAGWLQEELAGEARVAEDLQGIQGATARAKSLVRQILTFSRQQPEERRVIALEPVVREAVSLLRATLPATIEIRTDLGEADALILADPTQVHQVIVNLGTNAVHAMRAAGGILRLSQTIVDGTSGGTLPATLPPGRYVRLTVSDTGHGMSVETLRRIFDPFFTTKAPAEGTGLGMAVVHGIMRSHEGDIGIHSRPGEGTEVVLHFPLVERQEASPDSGIPPVPRGAGERILLVDDESELVRLGTRMLTQLGYRVSGYASPQEALAAFRGRPEDVDLVVSDLTMPGITGADLAREVLSLRPELPVLLTSGYLGALTPEAMEEIGIRELLVKPFESRTLGEAIWRCLRGDGPRAAPAVS